MPFATWWRGDPLPDLSDLSVHSTLSTLAPLPTFSAHPSTDVRLIAGLTNLSPQAIDARLRADHRPYVAFLDEEPVAYGWVATRQGGISGFHFSFTVPPDTAYLWDFLTLPQWRGRGVYPRLLQSIIQQEPQSDYFWIGYEPGNERSARGISKAGFRLVCDLVISPEGRVVGLTLFEESERAEASAAVFNLPVVR